MELGKLRCSWTMCRLFSEENFKRTDFTDRFGSEGKIKYLHEEPSSKKWVDL